MVDIQVGKIGEGVQVFSPDEPGLVERRGKLVVLIEGDGVGSEKRREIMMRSSEVFYGEELNTGQVIEEIVEILKREYSGIRVCILAVQDRDIFCGFTETFGIWVKNGEKEGWVIEPGGELPQGIVRGRVSEEMVMVIGSDQFWEGLPMGLIKSEAAHALQTRSAELAARKIVGHTGSNKLAAVVMFGQQVQKEEDKKVEPAFEQEMREENRQVVFKKKLDVKRWMEKFRQQEIYVNEENGTKKKKLMTVAIIFLVILGLVFLAGRARNKQLSTSQSVQEDEISQIVFQYREAKGIVGMNKLRAKEILDNVGEKIGQLPEEQRKDGRIADIEQEIGQVLGAATGVKTANLGEVTNLSLAREDVKIGGLLMGDTGLWVLDEGGDRLFKVDPNSGAVEVARGKGEVGEVKFAAIYPGRVVVFSDRGIIECGQPKGSACLEPVKIDTQWKNVVGMAMWAGNIYLLDNGSSQIWKLAAIEKGYGNGNAWLKEADSNLSSGSSISIDGSVWTFGGGKVNKYTGGAKENFEIANLDKALGQNGQIYVPEDGQNLYILDKDNSRIVIATKTGEYVEQVVNEKFGQIRGLVVDEKAKKIYIADEKAIWSVTL